MTTYKNNSGRRISGSAIPDVFAGQQSLLTDDGQLDAEALKKIGMALSDANTDTWWRDCCDRGIVELAARSYRQGGTEFISFELVALGVPEPDDGRRFGPRMQAAAKAGIVEKVRLDNGKRSTSHGAPVTYWRGTALAAELSGRQVAV